MAIGAVVLLVAVTSGRPQELAPVYVWVIVFSLLCAKPGDRFGAWMSWPLVHPWAQALGRVSYGTYLAHLPVLAIVQFGLLNLTPGLNRVTHFCLLFAGTVLVTLPLANVIYATIEAPFMRWGQTLARSWGGRSPGLVRAEAARP